MKTAITKDVPTDKKWVALRVSSPKFTKIILEKLGLKAYRSNGNRNYLIAHISEQEWFSNKHKIWEHTYCKLLGGTKETKTEYKFVSTLTENEVVYSIKTD